ncbi:MAG: carboxypeptidase regulatory-like domain-containing protein [Ignavibacteriales bacterium]|nr:carboxypeptidase regulatory-like domain-containing protein [Ignavibacteriales bacterium]
MAEGFLPQFWDHKHSPLEANRIPLTENTSGIDFNLEPRLQGTGSITGVVRNAQDSTALESHVLGFMKDTTGHFTGFVAFARTDSTGAYTLEHLPNGSFIVLAKAEHDFVPTFYNTSGGTPFLDSATAVDVSGSAVTGIDIYVQPDSAEGLNSIAGQIQSSSSQMERIPTLATPVAGALVAIKNSSNQVVGTAVSLEDGSYLAPGLAPGTYTVVFQKPGKTTASTPVSVTYVNNTPTMTTVNAQLSDASGSGPLGTMNVHASWNLVSLPVTVTDASKSSVFPMAISAAFRYVPGSGYQTSSILDYGAGYWVKFPAAQAFSISGTARTNQSITVSADWNLIGSLSSSIATTAITSTPPGIIASKFFGYNGGYTLASSLEPGKGYWVKSSSAGTLTMNTGASTPKSGGSIIADLEGLNSLTIKDRSGNSQTLYFGSNTNSINRTLYQLPPSPPADAFDVRFASHQLIEMHPSSMKTMMEFPITVQSAREPLTIRWIINDNTAGYKITDANGKSFTPSYMTGKGSLQLNASGVTRLSLQAQPKELPKEFALHQNFPNPFNPSTNISFDLPKASIVTLRVYNILGQEVTTLLNAITLDAGAHAISFDASALGTGVYFYKLQANEFVSVKKMMLIR